MCGAGGNRAGWDPVRGPAAGLQWAAVSVEAGLRILRSAPAMGTAAAATRSAVAGRGGLPPSLAAAVVGLEPS